MLMFLVHTHDVFYHRQRNFGSTVRCNKMLLRFYKPTVKKEVLKKGNTSPCPECLP